MVVQEVKSSKQLNYGYDVLREKYGDMMESGVTDPTKVARAALQNAASVAALMITTQALITDMPEKEKAPGGMPPMGGGGMPPMGGGGMY